MVGSGALRPAQWLLGLVIGLAFPQTLAAAAAPAPADQPAPPAFSASNRPRIGLVLGGGGAKGFAHIGVIEELERRHIPIDVISGTSMGAVVGSLYAIGNDAGQIKAITRAIDWKTIFDDSLKRNDLSFRRKREVRDIFLNARLGVSDGKPVLPTGVLGGQRLFAAVQELFAPWRATEDFDQLPIPFRAVASNIVTGEHVVMGSGNLSTAVFASMSIPAGFPPVEREGLLLVDGSISDNVPIDVARAMGVDVVIAVDVGEPPKASADKINNALAVISQMQSLLGYDAIRRQRASMTGRDVLIDPDITGLSVTAFDQAELGIERGRQAAQKMGDQLQALAVGDAEWAKYLAQRRARANPVPIRIAKVEIVNTSKVETREVAALITTRPGDVLSGPAMKRDIESIFALDAFDRVDYRIDVDPAGNTLRINADGNSVSEKYYQTGVILASNFGKAATFDLAVGYTDLDFLGLGAAWRGFARIGSDVLFDVSLYKQFGNLFVEPVAAYQRYSSLLIQQGSNATIASLQVARAGAGVDGGMVFGNWGELRAGVRIGGINPGVDSVTVGVSSGWNRDVDWRIGFTVDTLDKLTFPREGLFADIQYVDHVAALGGAFTRNNVIANVQKPFTWDRLTVIVGGRLGTTAGGLNDFVGDFQTGGFLNLSGLQRNSLIGRQLLFGRTVGFYQLTDKSPIIDLPIFIGGSLEAGNVWTNTSDISLGNLRTAASAFVAADTPIGPIWLAYGRSGSNSSIYLVIGRVF
jgi:NTE family protein